MEGTSAAGGEYRLIPTVGERLGKHHETELGAAKACLSQRLATVVVGQAGT